MSSSSPVVPITPHLLVQNEGTVFLFCPLISQGQELIDAYFRPDTPWFGIALGYPASFLLEYRAGHEGCRAGGGAVAAEEEP